MTRPSLIVAIVALSAWIGASLIVAASVAPSAFAVLPSRTLAGALVGRVLPVIFWSGLLVSCAALFVAWQAHAGWIAMAALGASMAACAVAQLLISPRIARIRDSVGGPIDALATGDPQRQLFGQLHALSVMLMGAAMLCTVGATIIFARLLLGPITPAPR